MILIIDLEATCADDGSIPPEQMEIIEVGACWVTPDGTILDRFQSFVHPVINQQLTPFCIKLTGIEQANIGSAPSWPAVTAALAEFVQRHQQSDSFWGSWGNYDARQIERECVRHGTANPVAQLPHKNLKAAFAKHRHIKQVGMATALRIVGLSLEGPHHRALSDALNIARLLPWT